MDLLGEANYCGHVVTPPRSSPRTIRTHAHALDIMSSSHARRTFSLALAALIASLACGTALAHQAPLGRDDIEDNAGRALLDHDADSFRTIDDGGAHNALDLGKPVGDQATATTCNGRDDFVRTAGDQFTLGGKKFVFAGWNQWEVLEAASGAPPPFRHLPLPGREHIVRIMNEAVDAGLKVVRMWAHTVSFYFYFKFIFILVWAISMTSCFGHRSPQGTPRKRVRGSGTKRCYWAWISSWTRHANAG